VIPDRPVFELRLQQNSQGKTEVWDPVRKKYLLLTPEEWVRQQFLTYLIQDLKFPKTLLSVEKGIQYNGLSKRIDLMISDRRGMPFLLAEFKSPEIALSDQALFQSSLYNYKLGAKYLVLDNQVSSFIWKESVGAGFEPISHFPEVHELG
jgi:hypothetical protein